MLCILLLLTGCTRGGGSVERALALRKTLVERNGCSFDADITADYGDNVYVFSMECTTDKEGNLTFCVTEPETIAGISGKISDNGGAITFDDKVFAFQTIADGQITPVTGPWLFIKTLRSGYLNGCAKTDTGLEISIDDSYAEDALHLNVWTDADGTPTGCEIFWQGRRILSIAVKEFSYL